MVAASTAPDLHRETEDLKLNNLQETTGISSVPLQHQLLLLGIDTLLWTHVALFISDITFTCTLHPAVSGGIYIYKTHPIKNVRISGILVAIERSSKYVKYSVDDGTALISCLQWNDCGDRTNDHLQLGYLVSVMGHISDFRDERQIGVHSIRHETDPNFESSEWLTVISLKMNVYDKPLVIPSTLQQAVIDSFGGLITPIPSVIEESQKSLLDVVSDHIGSLPSNSEIKFSAIAENVQLRNHAIQCWGKDSPMRAGQTSDTNTISEPTEHKVTKLFCSVFSTLVDMGVISYLDEESDSYERISHEENLGMRVLEIIRDECRSGHVKFRGVSEDTVVLCLREEARFQRVPRVRIVESIQRLMANSDIYSIDSGHFAAV